MIVNRLEKLCRICVESLVQRINAGIRLKGWLKKREREREKKGKERGQIGRGEKKKRTGSNYAVCSFVDAGAICKINETRRNINATRMLLLLLLLLRSPIEISLKNHPIYVDRSHRRAG